MGLKDFRNSQANRNFMDSQANRNFRDSQVSRNFRDSQVRRDYRHSPTNKYISKYMNEIENSRGAAAISRLSTEIEGSAKYNPERTNYGTSLRSSFYREPSSGYSGVLGNISNSKITGSNSIETLGRELDDRIAKIKQKYYESGESGKISGEWRGNVDLDRSLQERRVNNYVSQTWSRHDRDPVRQALYAPYNATRSISYHYDYQ